MPPDYVIREACRICGSQELGTFLDLGSTPLANSFIPLQRVREPESVYPLATARCAISAVVHTALTGTPPPKCFDSAMMSGTTPSC